MTDLFNRETSVWETVPEASVTEAVASGRYALKKGDVAVVSPDGKLGTIPSSRAVEAFRSGGFRFRTTADERQAEARKVADEHPVLVGLTHAANAATFGALAQHGDFRDREFLVAGEEASPAAALTGKVVGGIASAAPAGGVAGLAARGVVGALAGTAIRGAVEGAVIGAGDLISEEGLGRAEFTASAVAAHVGMGAILGGGVSGLLAAAPKVIPAAQRAVGQMPGKGKVQDFLKELSDDQALKTVVGHQKRAFKQLEGKGLYDDAAKFVREEAGLALGDSTASMAAKIPAAVEKVGKQLDDMVAKLDQATGGAAVDPARVAIKLRDIAKAQFSTQSDDSVRSWLLGQADELDAMGPIGFARGVVERRGAQRAASYNAMDPKPLALAKRLKASAWNDVMDDLAAPHLKKAGMAGDAWRQLRRKDWVGIELSKFAEDRVAGDAANSFLSISDIMTGSGAGVMTGSAFAGLAAAGARKAAKEYGSAAVSLAAGRLAKMRFLQTAQQQVGQRVQGSVLKLLAGGKPRAISPASVAALTKFTLGDGKAATQQEAAKLRVAEVDKALLDPNGLADRVAASVGGLEGDAPNTTAALAGKAAQALQYLASVAPRPSGVTLQPQLQTEEWVPSKAEAAKFARCWAAVMDPLSVVDDLEAGILSSEAIEALRAVYPELLDLIATEVQMQAAAHGKPISYATKVQLSMLLGKPLDNSLKPEAIKRNQSFAQAENAAGKGGGGTRLAGIDQLDMNISSRTQQLEASVAKMK